MKPVRLAALAQTATARCTRPVPLAQTGQTLPPPPTRLGRLERRWHWAAGRPCPSAVGGAQPAAAHPRGSGPPGAHGRAPRHRVAGRPHARAARCRSAAAAAASRPPPRRCRGRRPGESSAPGVARAGPGAHARPWRATSAGGCATAAAGTPRASARCGWTWRCPVRLDPCGRRCAAYQARMKRNCTVRATMALRLPKFSL